MVSYHTATGARCGNNRVSSQRYVLSGAAEKHVRSFQDIEEILAAGEAQKRVAVTAMNDRYCINQLMYLFKYKCRASYLLVCLLYICMYGYATCMLFCYYSSVQHTLHYYTTLML